MTNWVSVAEAVQYTSFSHSHVAWLVRNGKIKGRKSGNIWLIDLDDLKRYEQEMQDLGTKKHTPKS
jgi:excisionase family DNA binding protein